MASRRARKTDRGIKDFENLLNAVKEVKIEKKKILRVAKAYGIPDNSLGRYIKKLDDIVPDISAVPDDQLLKILKESTSYSHLVHVYGSQLH